VYAGVRAIFLAVMVAALTVAYATDYAFTGPVFIAAQMVLVALVRYSWSAYDKWARECVLWLNVGDVDAWAAWQRDYVAWAERQQRRAPGQLGGASATRIVPAAVTAR
jgi:hypothetical protein